MQPLRKFRTGLPVCVQAHVPLNYTPAAVIDSIARMNPRQMLPVAP